jgi:hypothetical protein
MATNKYGYILAIAAILVALSCTAMPKPYGASLTAEDHALKNWALSYCLASTMQPCTAKQDALNTAGAYLQQGHQPIEAYDETKKLIDMYLAKNYTGSTPGTFNTKKCIDLYESHELQILLHKYRK